MPVSLERIAQEAIDTLAPLPSYFASPDAATEIFTRLGYAVAGPALAPVAADLSKLADDINKLVDRGQQFQAARAAGTAGYVELTELIAEIALVIDDLSKLPAKLAALNLSASFFTDLLALLLVDYLEQRQPGLRALLEFISVIEQTYTPAQPGGPAVGFRMISFHWDRLLDFVQQPKQWAKELYGWGTSDFNHAVFLLRLSTIFDAFGLFAPVVEIPPDILATFFPSGQTAPSRPQALRLPMYHVEHGLGTDTAVEAGIIGLPVDGKQAPTLEDTGIGLMPYADGVAEGTVAVTPVLDFFYSGSADVAGGIVLALRPNSGLDITVGGQSNVASSGKLRLELRFKPATGAAAVVLLGEPDSLRLDAQKVFVGGGVTVMNMKPDVSVEAGVSGGRIVIAMSQADGFLAKVLPPDGIQVKFDILVGWSQAKGLYFDGSAGLETTLALGCSLGPVLLESLWLSFGVTKDGLQLQAGLTAGVSIGPVAASIDKIGMKLFLRFANGNLGPVDLGFGFKPPTGLGIDIDAGPLSGGGFITFDEDTGRYAGILTLSLFEVSITAIGLLDTKLPDGQSGFSFLIVISVTFSGIQIGFGLTLNGVGGLCGINRSMITDAIQSGLRHHSLDSILFPPDPIKNAPQIISTLSTIYPPAEGRYVFGPIFEIGWGTPTLVTAKIGVLIEVPAPIIIAILGQLAMALPDPDAPAVEIHVDVLGVIDFGKKLFSLDATIHDSRIVKFTITGDMAMRLLWGDNPNFLFSVGGFNPHYQAPPNFPTLQRITLALDMEVVRLTLQAYLAVTSNTFQLGAHLELYMASGSFNVYGWLGFDALIIFSPFSFVVDFTAGLALRSGTSTLMGILLTGRLSGPTPWHAEGNAHVSILFFEIGVHVSVTVGDAQSNPVQLVNAWTPLAAAVQAQGNWSGALPPGSPQVVTLAPPETDAAPVLVDPAGTLTFRQKVVPLNQAITKFGEAAPDQQAEFDLTAVDLGGSNTPFTTVTDEFAPGQYHKLSDADKLSLPSFEPMTAGFEIGDQAVDFGKQYHVDIEFETVIVDSPSVTRRGSRYALLRGHLMAMSRTGAAARGALFTTGIHGSDPTPGSPSEVTMDPEMYVIAGVDDLAARSDISEPTTKSDAFAALADHLAANPADRGTLQVVPQYELAGTGAE